MAQQFPPCPGSLKAIQHYLKTASEHDQRDPVVSYWCRLYALQMGLKIDRKSDEAKILLTFIMDWLERQKKILSDNEAITNDIAAQAHIENYALKLFLYADSQDRAANFTKNVVKAFYTAGMLFDVLTTFGDLTEEVLQNRKYAKWKAAYIHNCLKNGETPVPGPMQDGENEEDFQDSNTSYNSNNLGFVNPSQPSSASQSEFSEPSVPDATASQTLPGGSSLDNSLLKDQSNSSIDIPGGSVKQGNVSLTPDQMSKAQKYCKWASSALNYDDVPTAITNLQKALKLLETGIDS